MRLETSSASTEHKGQRSFRLDVDRTLMSILSLVNKSRILGFLIAYMYNGNLNSSYNSRKVTKRLDVLIR